MKRLFVAVNLSEEVRRNIADIIPPVGTWLSSDDAARITWVRPEKLHLTLKFLGATDPARIPDIVKVLRETVSSFPIKLTAIGLGVFPNKRTVRVLWVGLMEDQGSALARMAANIDERLRILGFTRENRLFVPHLTIGRVKRFPLSALALQQLEERRQMVFGAFTVNELVLYESQTLPTGARYTPLEMIRKP